MKIPLGRLALSTLFLFASAVLLVAQDLDDVTISGRIIDLNGQPVAGSTVTATHSETALVRTTTSDDKGVFQFLKLKPGTYNVKIEGGGFSPQERTDLQTVSGQVIQLEFKLAPGIVNVQQTVNVNDEDVSAADTTRTVVGSTITQREIEEIPNNSRNALDLVLTLGGTSEEQLSTNGLADDRKQNPSGTPLEQGNFSLSGGTAYSNNITIDGLDNNDDRSSRDRFQPSLETIAEVQIIRNQFSAEYGRASGGRINIRTRSGGNRLRGRAFMFYRDDNFDANTWYNNSRGITRPPLREADPGFFISGPVVIPYLYNGHNRTFFAVGYEYLNLHDTTQIDTYIPIVPNPRYTLPAPNGTEQFCDNASPAACPASAGFISPYSQLYLTPNISNVVTARIDHQLFSGNDLTLGFQFARKHNRRTNGSSTTRIEDAFQEKNNNTQAYNISDNQVLGPHVVNQFRAQWSEYTPSYQTPGNVLDPAVLVGFRNPVTNSVQTLIAGNSTTSTSINFADSRDETRWQFQDSLTYILGRHTLKGGFDVQNVVSKTLGLGDATGTFNFGSVLQYSNNQVTRFRQNFGTSQDVTNTYYGVFLNDEFKPKSNLTVSYGLRFEKETAVDDNNNLGPRLGIAWDPFKKGKGVVRFGAGIFYNRVLLRTVGDSIQNAGGNLVSFDSNTIGTSATDDRRVKILEAISNRFPGSYATVDDLKTLVVSACGLQNTTFTCNSNTGFAAKVSSAGNPLRSVDSNLQIPESYQFNIGFEREIFKGWVFEANYTWNRTVRLWRDFNPNVPVLPQGYADWTAYLIANPFILSPTRTYTFYLGSSNDGSGIATTQGGTVACGTATANCFVNLNTSNASSTAPAVAAPGQNGNATGGPIGIALAAIARFRPDQTVEETSRIGSRGRAFYQGLVLEMRSRYQRLGHGFGANFRFAYTLSGTKDDGLNNTANAEINGDFDREWARNLQDRRHRIAFTGTFDTPLWFGRLKFSPLIRYGSSAPFDLGAGGSDRNLDDVATDRLNFSGNLKDIVWRNPGTPLSDALIAEFSLPPIGAAGSNLPRNAGKGPAFYTFDLNVTREWKLHEHMRLRPVLEVDNVFNAAVFSFGAEFVDFQALRNDGIAPTATQLAARQNFLVPTRTYRQRQMRIGLRFDF